MFGMNVRVVVVRLALLALLMPLQDASADACPTVRSVPAGPTPYSNGVTFRVWAPFASGVSVAGTFNGWSSTATPLCAEGNGHWSRDVDGVLAGAQFKYVVRNGTNTLWRRDPRARQVVNSVGNSIVYNPAAFSWTDDPSTVPFFNEAVIYEMHVGTFNDATPSNGVPASLTDAAAKLDYLADLGVNMIELLPIFEFQGDYSWGYNPADPYAVESVYGGPDALKNFVNQAHARNIAVTLDVVFNHLGPSDLSLWQFDGWSMNSLGGIYFYNDSRANTPWGNTRPDYGTGPVRSFLRDNIFMWIDECHVDGFRWDATAYIRNALGNNNDPANDIADGWSLMQWINNDVDALTPWVINIAEDMKGNDYLTRGTASGGAGFDTQWDAGFVHPIRAAIQDGSDANRNMNTVASAIALKYNNDAFDRVIYTESHDEVANGKQRVPPTIDPGNPGSYWARKRSTLGAALTMTSPGIPMIFQGQEFLEDGWFADTDPLDWSKTTTYAGIRQLYKDLIHLRKNAGGITRGLTGQSINTFHVNDLNKIIAYHRWMNGGVGDDVIIVANFGVTSWAPSSNYRIGFPRGGTWNVIFNSDSTAYGSDYSNVGSVTVNAEAVPYNGLAYSGTISIGPYGVLILSQGTGAPVDNPPTATVLTPTANSTVSGSVNLSASAQDDIGVAEVRFYAGATLVGTDTTAPYSVSWDSTAVGDGIHTVRVTAVDTTNQTASASVVVTVDNIDTPPTAAITAPVSGSTVSGTVSIAASASDDVGVAHVRFYIDGVLTSTDTNAPYSHSWNTTTATNGLHSIRAVAQDTIGQTGEQLINVTVSNRVGFLSSYSSMTMAASFNGWNTGLNNMSLISNYTWRINQPLVTNKQVQLKFAANGNWTVNWGDNNQNDRSVPLTQTAEASGSNIKIDPNLNGTYRITFNEQTRQYSVIKN